MKVVIKKTKDEKVIHEYKAEDGLVFKIKKHCLFYEQKHMTKKKES